MDLNKFVNHNSHNTRIAEQTPEGRQFLQSKSCPAISTNQVNYTALVLNSIAMQRNKFRAWGGDFAKHLQYYLPGVPVLWQIRGKRSPCLLFFVPENGQSLRSSDAPLFQIFYSLPHPQPSTASQNEF